MANSAAHGWERRLRRAAQVALTAPSPSTPSDEYLLSPFETGAEYEDVTFPSVNASERAVEERMLRGWWYPRPESKRVVICCPGYRGTKSDLIGIGMALWRAGFNVLTFDFHGHGADHGAQVTLGYREVQDLFGALDYAHTRVADAQIGVIGYSMGASVNDAKHKTQLNRQTTGLVGNSSRIALRYRQAAAITRSSLCTCGSLTSRSIY